MANFKQLVEELVACRLAEDPVDDKDDVGAGSHDILPQGHESHMQQDPVTNDEQLESVLARMQNLYTALGPESLIGRATLAAQRMIRLNLQPLQAERQKAHDEKAAAMLLGFCLDEISSVIKRIAEHQDPGVVSDEVCVTTVTKEENERWRYEILFNMCVMSNLLSRQLVPMPSLMSKLTSVLAGQYWIWDRRRGAWITPSQLPIIADDLRLGEIFCKSSKMPIIFLDEAYSLEFTAHKKQSAAPPGQLLLEIFWNLKVPSLSELVEEVPHYDPEALSECSYRFEMLHNFAVFAVIWVSSRYPSGQASAIIDAFRQRLLKLKISTANDLMVSYQLTLDEVQESSPLQVRCASWFLNANAEDGSAYFLLRGLDGVGQTFDLDSMVNDVAVAFSRMVLEGSHCFAADINSMATKLQPLTRHMLLQWKQHGSEVPSAADWQALDEYLMSVA